jgi:tRNA pseudouridine32 synthase/23S rRNA pseudouridine746 synthase
MQQYMISGRWVWLNFTGDGQRFPVPANMAGFMLHAGQDVCRSSGFYSAAWKKGAAVQTDDITIVHADAHLVVVNKPGGLLAVPGRGPDKQDCVVKRVKQKFPACIEQPAVHRLDMATSGLMVLARTAETHGNLCRQFSERMVKKKYIALLEGVVTARKGKITLAFRLDPENRPYQVYDALRGKTGITRWQRLQINDGRTRVEFVPLTGRTHQLRLHAAHELGLGCPIVGDSLYGSGKQGDPMLLHAAMLSFYHPQKEKWMKFTSVVPF